MSNVSTQEGKDASLAIQVPEEQVNLRPSNSQDWRTKGISGAMPYWGFLGILSVSSNASITYHLAHLDRVTFKESESLKV